MKTFIYKHLYMTKFELQEKVTLEHVHKQNMMFEL